MPIKIKAFPHFLNNQQHQAAKQRSIVIEKLKEDNKQITCVFMKPVGLQTQLLFNPEALLQAVNYPLELSLGLEQELVTIG